MEQDMMEVCKNYLDAAEAIRKKQLMSLGELAYEIGITYVTMGNVYRKPETCSLKTLRKFKKFVDNWNSSNVSVTH